MWCLSWVLGTFTLVYLGVLWGEVCGKRTRHDDDWLICSQAGETGSSANFQSQGLGSSSNWWHRYVRLTGSSPWSVHCSSCSRIHSPPELVFRIVNSQNQHFPVEYSLVWVADPWFVAGSQIIKSETLILDLQHKLLPSTGPSRLIRKSNSQTQFFWIQQILNGVWSGQIWVYMWNDFEKYRGILIIQKLKKVGSTCTSSSEWFLLHWWI